MAVLVLDLLERGKINMELNPKLPPHNIEAEQSALGAMILDKGAISDVVEIIESGDFYKEAHSEIFSAILRLYGRNEPVDIVTLSDDLTRAGMLEAVGGIEYLSDLTSFGVLSTNARHYATIIEEKSMLRTLIRTSSEVLERGYDNEGADTLLEFAEQTIFDISQKKNRMGLEPIREVLIKAYERIEALYASKASITGLSTGFKDLDYKLSGLQKSDLVLVAARPSMGKTAFALNLCQNAALRNDASVAVFSLEMSKEQLVQRMLSSEAQIPMQNMRNGKLAEDDWVALTKAMSKLSAAKIHIDDTPAITPLELRAKCRRLKMEKGLDMIMIDYLQLMNVSGRAESRQQEISTISRSLKAIAREMDCPVVALSQLSRAPELRADHRPMLSDLRESGAIEQDADVVMFLYRDEYYDKESERKNIADLIIAKQRNGEVGDVELVWLGQYAKFADKAHYVDEPVF